MCSTTSMLWRKPCASAGSTAPIGSAYENHSVAVASVFPPGQGFAAVGAFQDTAEHICRITNRLLVVLTFNGFLLSLLAHPWDNDITSSNSDGYAPLFYMLFGAKNRCFFDCERFYIQGQGDYTSYCFLRVLEQVYNERTAFDNCPIIPDEAPTTIWLFGGGRGAGAEPRIQFPCLYRPMKCPSCVKWSSDNSDLFVDLASRYRHEIHTQEGKPVQRNVE